jgi:mannose-1-phosphate guanylyltransferase
MHTFRKGKEAKMRHAVIMAGGAGTRLWPLSRKMRPKQLMRLFDGKSLLQIARDRLTGVFEPQNIWVITSAHYLDLVAEELGDIPRENLIGEPEGRDTSNAIGLAAALLQRRDPDATMAVFTADHIIRPQDTFAAAIDKGLTAAEDNAESLVTYGIKPTQPHTGYGYLWRGEKVTDDVYEVREFKEKPDDATAQQYFQSGEYYWNSGMFAWRVAAIQQEIERNLPENYAVLQQIAEQWGGEEANQKFATLKKISIDFGVMEKARRVLTVEMNCEWLDLGSWTSIGSTQEPDTDGNVAIAERAVTMDSRNNVIVTESGHLVAALGVEDLIIVHSGDATLVCHKDQEQAIKQLGEKRQERYGSEYE